MDEGVCAVRAGVDLGRHARLLSSIHDAQFSGDHLPSQPRRLVQRAWARSRDLGVEPDGSTPGPLPFAEVERRRAASPLARALPGLRAALTAVAEDTRHIMVVTDADGVVLWREGARRVRDRADGLGFTEGADWSEAAVGSNAIGTALAEAAPVQMFGAEHLVRAHHVWTCTAHPVHDPRTGDLLGVVDVSGPVATAHAATVALVGTAVKLAEADLWRLHQRGLESLRRFAAPLLARFDSPAMVADDNGWVAAVTGMPTLDRVARPRPHRPVLVPGVGACLPEPVPGGWLLRPAAAGRVHLTLDLAAAAVTVRGAAEWTHPLRARHRDLLGALAAHPAGLDAKALSRALFGDDGHVVAVRAEMSRLRRVLGGMLLTGPYRFSPDVRVSVTG